MRQYESYKCNKCNNVVEVQHVGKGELTCCGTPMECITKDLTSVNLMKAFTGESQARNKYDYFADVAEDSNLPVIAEVFRETAINEMFHARLEFEAYAKMNNLNLDDNSSNLDAAAGGEHYEHTTMYPDFAKIAKEEGHKDIAKLFEMISEVEISHEKRYKDIKHALETKGFYETDKEVYWVCELCGHVHKGKKAPGVCQLCGAPKELFKIKK